MISYSRIFILVTLLNSFYPSCLTVRYVENQSPVFHDISTKVGRSRADLRQQDNGHHQYAEARAEEPPGSNSDICMTEECVLAAASFIKSMDRTVDPCEDFYSYACGKYAKETPIPQFAASVSVMGTMRENMEYKLSQLISYNIPANASGTDKTIKDFYMSCLDTDTMNEYGFQPVLDLFEKHHLPFVPFMAPRDFSENPVNPVTILREILKMNLVDTGLFGLDLSPDPENSRNRTLLMFYQPTLTIPPNVYKSRNGEKVLELYGGVLLKVAMQMRDFLLGKRHRVLNDNGLLINVKKFLFFEAKLMEIFVAPSDSGAISQESFEEKAHFTQADSRMPLGMDINPLDISKEALKSILGKSIRPDEKIVVPHLKYFQSLKQLLTQMSDYDIANYLIWREIIQMVKMTTNEARQTMETFENMVQGRIASPPRWSSCTKSAISQMSAKVAQLLVDNIQGDQIIDHTKDVISSLRVAMKQMIQESDWLKDDAKDLAIEKLDAIRAFDGYSGDLSKDGIEKLYLGVKPLNKSYLHNVYTLKEYWVKQYFKTQLGQAFLLPLAVGNFRFDTTITNAMYMPQLNSIVVPIGIQQPPIYRDRQLQVLTFGSLGFVVGHEFTHGFDNNGAKFDKEGNFRTWWDNGTSEAFEEKQQCFVDQYNQFRFKIFDRIPGYKGPTGVNGTQTLGENIADNGGLKEAYRAYQLYKGTHNITSHRLPGLSQLNEDQLFFLSFATVWCEAMTVNALVAQLMTDVHAPAMTRVNGVLQNFDVFRQAFSCPSSAFMSKPFDNKNIKCKLW